MDEEKTIGDLIEELRQINMGKKGNAKEYLLKCSQIVDRVGVVYDKTNRLRDTTGAQWEPLGIFITEFNLSRESNE